jgi:autophagy-related protein 2
MRLTLSLIDSCVKLVAPNHPGALAIVIGEVHFSTDVIASASETVSDSSLRSVTVLVVDDEKPETDEVSSTPSKVRFANDVDIWKVSSRRSLNYQSELTIIHTY